MKLKRTSMAIGRALRRCADVVDPPPEPTSSAPQTPSRGGGGARHVFEMAPGHTVTIPLGEPPASLVVIGEGTTWQVPPVSSTVTICRGATSGGSGPVIPPGTERDGVTIRGYLSKQMRWSLETFGPGRRTHAILDHLARESCEVLAAPDDGMEWVDIVILGLDGAWRAGFTPAQVERMLVSKQDVNMLRRWPDWRSVDPRKAIEHVRGENEPEKRGD
jgi:Protein of unknown function (DUF550)